MIRFPVRAMPLSYRDQSPRLHFILRARGENQNRFSSRWIMLNTLKHYLVMTRNKWEYAWVWFFCTLIEWVILCIYVDRFFLNVIFLLPTWTSKIDQIKCRDFLIYFSFVPSLCTAAIQYIYVCRNMEKKCVAIVIIVISLFFCLHRVRRLHKLNKLEMFGVEKYLARYLASNRNCQFM